MYIQMEKDAVVPVSGDELLNLQKPCSVVRTEGSQIVGSLASTSPKEQNKEAFLYTGAATEQHSTVFMQRMEQDMPHHFFLTPIKVPFFISFMNHSFKFIYLHYFDKLVCFRSS